MSAKKNTEYVRYAAVGDVRGWCGHEHRTIAAAAQCAHRDSTCPRYTSDRSVVALAATPRGDPPRIDTRDLTDDEIEEVFDAT